MNTQTEISIDEEKFEVLDKISEGGFGVLYRVRQRQLDRVVAMKVLNAPDSEEVLRRFQREAKALSAIRHPGVVQVYDHGVCQDGKPYILMQYIEGETLAERLQKGPLPVSEVISLFIQVANALAAVHAEEIVHRDLKPSNIMFCRDGAVKLIDFGLMRRTGLRAQDTVQLTFSGQTVGTVFYMSPEQCRGETVDARADIYSLGCVMFEALTGKPPFNDQNQMAVMMQHVHTKPLFSDALQDDSQPEGKLRKIIRKCLRKEPSKRYGCCADLVADLEDEDSSVDLYESDERPALPIQKTINPQKQIRRPSFEQVITKAALMLVVLPVLAMAGGLYLGKVQTRPIRFEAIHVREGVTTHNSNDSERTPLSFDSVAQAPVVDAPSCMVLGFGKNEYYIASLGAKKYSAFFKHKQDVGYQCASLASSSDGTTIVLDNCNLYRLQRDGSRRQLLNYNRKALACARYCSENTLHVATVSKPGLDSTFYTVRQKDLVEAPLAMPAGFGGAFAFAPDGKLVAAVKCSTYPDRFKLVRWTTDQKWQPWLEFKGAPLSWDIDDEGNLVFITEHHVIGCYKGNGCFERFATCPFTANAISCVHHW